MHSPQILPPASAQLTHTITTEVAKTNVYTFEERDGYRVLMDWPDLPAGLCGSRASVSHETGARERKDNSTEESLNLHPK